MPYYVTTPIYYVNGEPHLGHAYTTIAADVLARHMRQRGDRNAVRFKELAARLNVTNDFFIRTTDREHMEKVAEVVQRIYDNGHVYAGTYEGWYCPRCADFKTAAAARSTRSCSRSRRRTTGSSGCRHSRSRWSAFTRSCPAS